jgi:hypothetical protein
VSTAVAHSGGACVCPAVLAWASNISSADADVVWVDEVSVTLPELAASAVAVAASGAGGGHAGRLAPSVVVGPARGSEPAEEAPGTSPAFAAPAGSVAHAGEACDCPELSATAGGLASVGAGVAAGGSAPAKA